MMNPYFYNRFFMDLMLSNFTNQNPQKMLRDTSENNGVLNMQQENLWRMDEWNKTDVYWGGDRVTYNGNVYEAKWWTKGDEPGKSVANPWDTPWMLMSSNPNPTPDPSPTPDLDQNTKIVYPDYSSVNVGKGVKWPNRCFAPFVDSTGWPPLKFADMANDLMVPYFNLGFIVSESRNVCKPTWGTYYSAENGPLNDQVRLIREMGGDVMISFGGVANVPLHVSAPNVEGLMRQYKDFVKAYGLTRIDFDIEGAWLNDRTSLIRNSKALKMLQDELKKENYELQIWLTLPIQPSGLTQDGLNVIQYNLDEGVVLSGVNAMTMDYGDSVAPNPQFRMGQYGIEAITNLQKQLKTMYSNNGISMSDAELWAMVGTTPMIGMNDITSEVFYQSDATLTLDFAEQKNIGMISQWSLNRDKQCAGGSTNYVSISCSSIIQEPYEFSKIFNQYNNLENFDPNKGGVAPEPGKPEPGNGTMPIWTSEGIYVAGDKVTHNGRIYEAKWWNQNDRPDKKVNYEWETPWKLVQ